MIVLGLTALPNAASADPSPIKLQLEVVINGAPTSKIVSFVQYSDGSIGAAPSDLRALGLKVDDLGADDASIPIVRLPTLTYDYDERNQRISINVGSDLMRPHVLDVRPREAAPQKPPSVDWGAVVNYDLFGAAGNLNHQSAWSFGGSTLTLDGRAFSPFGLLEQTAIASVNPKGVEQTVRLNSTLSYSDPARLTTWTMGDIINGATTWSRPIRLGGFQVQSNFALRPDLVTTPLASLGGTAAVPSTVDLYVNNVRTYSQDVEAGPFNLVNIPLVNGAGNAQVIVRNASGQTVTASLPFFSSARLLAPGLSSWSVEAGLPRTAFGSSTDTYESRLALSATWLHGAASWLTYGGHVEGGSGVLNAATNLTFRTGAFGAAGAGVALSNYRGNGGIQASFSYDTSFRGINLSLGLERTLGGYEDLASATARLQSKALIANPVVYLSSALGATPSQINPALYENARAPSEIDHLTVSGPLGFDPRSNWSVSFVPTTLATGVVSRPLTASYSRTLPFNGTIFATAFQDLANSRSAGVFVGFSVPLGSNSISTDVSSGSGGVTSTVQTSKPVGLAPGDAGWSFRDSEGAVPFREFDVGLRSAASAVRLGVQQNPTGVSSTFDLSGSVATLGGHVFLSNTINDAFAVINAGAPGVPITSENRPVGTTDRHGFLLVPTLRSYQNNSIEMDPSKLPIDAEIESTRQVAVPAGRAGVLVSFATRHNTSSALITFVDDAGNFIPAGAAGHINGEAEFVLGYDGQSFINNLKDSNRVTIEVGNGVCVAGFPFQPAKGKQARIGPVVCHRTEIASGPTHAPSRAVATTATSTLVSTSTLASASIQGLRGVQSSDDNPLKLRTARLR